MQTDHNQSLTLEVRSWCRKPQERTTNVSPQNRVNAQQMSDLKGEIAMQKDHNQSLTLEVRSRCRKTQERTTNVSPQNRANAQQMSDLRGEIAMQKSAGVQVVEALGQPQRQLNALRPRQLLLLAVQ